jgi:hypothetical protein
MNTNETKMSLVQTIDRVTHLSPDSRKLFMDYLADADNWNGAPMWNHNVGDGSQRANGFLADWKKKGLVLTEVVEGANGVGEDVVLIFTQAVRDAYPQFFA